MKKYLPLLGLILSMAIGHAAVTGSVPNYTNASSVNDTDLLYDYQISGTHDHNATLLQVKNYVLTSAVLTSGTYSNPSWITALDWSKITNPPTFGTLSILTPTGSMTTSYVLTVTGSGTVAWSPATAGAITIGSNAAGILSYSSGVLNLVNPPNSAGSVVTLDGAAAIPLGLMGNYIGHSGGVQGYDPNTTILGNVVSGSSGTLVETNSTVFSKSTTGTAVLLGDGAGNTRPATLVGLTQTGTQVLANVQSVFGRTGTVTASASDLTNGTTGTGSVVLSVAPLLNQPLLSSLALAPESGTSKGWFVCWSGTQYVVATASNVAPAIETSPDGVTWTSQTVPASTVQVAGVAWSPSLSLFCAVAQTGTNRVLTSPDAVTWTVATPAEANQWASICWSPSLSLFCAVAGTGTHRVMTSPDGVTWTAQTAAAANTWASVCWSGTQFCAVAQTSTGGAAQIMTSPDGVTWTGVTPPEANAWISICWSPSLSLFCAVATNGTHRVMTSHDGVTWTAQTAAQANPWHSICWSPSLSLFCSVAGLTGATGNNRIMTSADGIHWLGQGATSTTDNWTGVGAGVNQFVAFNNTNADVMLMQLVSSAPNSAGGLAQFSADGSIQWLGGSADVGHGSMAIGSAASSTLGGIVIGPGSTANGTSVAMGINTTSRGGGFNACGGDYFSAGIAINGYEVAVSGSNSYSILSGTDDLTTPADQSTVQGWMHVHVNGVDAWMPYYR